MSGKYFNNQCRSTLGTIIPFTFDNDTYLLQTGYIIDFPMKLSSKLFEINNVSKLKGVTTPNCNWYHVDDIWNTGISTSSIWIQGPYYTPDKVQGIISVIEKEYPVTETMIAISFGLIFPICLFIIWYFTVNKAKHRRNGYY